MIHIEFISPVSDVLKLKSCEEFDFEGKICAELNIYHHMIQRTLYIDSILKTVLG